jgi:ligand-binding sensor domain-containing protein
MVYRTMDSILPHNQIHAMIIDPAGNKWIGTDKGSLVKFDGAWTKYKSPYESSINHWSDILAIDSSGNKWLGTSSGGLLKFDGTDWTVYNTHNSTLPDSNITALAIDALDNKWIGTPEGLVKFDGANWTNYFPYNSGLPVRNINALASDRSGNVWIGNGTAGLVEFDGTNWTTYDSTNSGLPFNAVRAIVIDPANTKWLITRGRLVKFNGSKWDVFDSSNSGFPSNTLSKLAIDKNGILWISTSYGLISYNDKLNPVRYPDFANKNTSRNYVSRIFPNPFKTTVMISFDLSRPGFISSSIFSISGKKIKTLFNGTKPAGTFKICWNGTDDSGKLMPSGVYFYEIASSSGRISGKLHLIR